MTVQQLIDELQKVEDKTLPVYVHDSEEGNGEASRCEYREWSQHIYPGGKSVPVWDWKEENKVVTKMMLIY